MAQNDDSILLKVSLIVFAVLTFIYGTGYLFFPNLLVEMSGGDPVPSGWLRWSGGVLLALTVGTILTLRKMKSQGPLVITFALGTLFSGLALIYNYLFEVFGNHWFTLVPAIATLVTSALLWCGWYQARDVLKSKS